ncbi:MAG: hypothetical protein IKD72_03765 [Clostridia bacterium]|nr:hypothetical protein [Clostridia bacterium]
MKLTNALIALILTAALLFSLAAPAAAEGAARGQSGWVPALTVDQSTEPPEESEFPEKPEEPEEPEEPGEPEEEIEVYSITQEQYEMLRDAYFNEPWTDLRLFGRLMVESLWLPVIMLYPILNLLAIVNLPGAYVEVFFNAVTAPFRAIYRKHHFNDNMLRYDPITGRVYVAEPGSDEYLRGIPVEVLPA